MFSSRPSFFTSTALPLKVNAVLRAITNAPLMRDKSVVRLSVTPSTKYSCSGSPPMFATAARLWTSVALKLGWVSCYHLCRQAGFIPDQGIGPHRALDVLEVLLAQINEPSPDL